MRKSVLFFVKTVLILGLVFAVSCGKDNGDNSGNNTKKIVSDPEGTITANIADGVFIHLNGDDGGMMCSVSWSKPDNVRLAGNDRYRISICGVGEVKGLGNITKIPTSGYTNPTASGFYPLNINNTLSCDVGCGYIVKIEEKEVNPDSYYYSDKTIRQIYARMYVVEKIVSTSGGVIGAKVKYQYPWNP
jgi:hypothetical protein